jgi:hypothetical protein
VEPGATVGVSGSLTKGPIYPNGDDPMPWMFGPLGVNVGLVGVGAARHVSA